MSCCTFSPIQKIMKPRLLVIISLIGIFLLLFACKNDNFEEIHPPFHCDTTGTISFATDILPIMIKTCGSSDMACHNTDQADGGYGLGTYDDVIFTIDDSGTFLKSITHDPSIASSKWMPKNSSVKTDACDIQKIEAWLNRGKLDN